MTQRLTHTYNHVYQELEGAMTEERSQAAKAKETVETLRAQSKKAEAANQKAMCDLKDKFDELKVENEELKARNAGETGVGVEADKENVGVGVGAGEDGLKAREELHQVQCALNEAVAKADALELEKADLEGQVAKMKDKLLQQRQKEDDYRERAKIAINRAREKVTEKDQQLRLLTSQQQKNTPGAALSERLNGVTLNTENVGRTSDQDDSPVGGGEHEREHEREHGNAPQHPSAQRDAHNNNGSAHPAGDHKWRNATEDEINSIMSASHSAHTPNSVSGDTHDHTFAAESANNRGGDDHHAHVHVPTDHSRKPHDGVHAHGGSAHSMGSDAEMSVAASEYRERALRLLEDKDRHIAELKAKLKAAEKAVPRNAAVRICIFSYLCV
jgi:hypothetical protein